MSTTDPHGRRPEPTQLISLEQAKEQESGTKVRLLACVHAYHGKRALLVLKQEFPSTTTASPVVLANISNVLEIVNHELLQDGAWLNIIGYVRKPIKTSIHERVRSNGRRRMKRSRQSVPLIEVNMIWSAGAIRLVDYQSAVQSYQESLPNERT